MTNLCIVCGREKRDSEEPWPSHHICPDCAPGTKAPSPPHAQDYPDLDAGGYLLVALGHLVKAEEKLDQEPPSSTRYLAKRSTVFATNEVRFALELLEEVKEETCEKS